MPKSKNTVALRKPQPPQQSRGTARRNRLVEALDKATLAIPRGTFAAMGGAAGGALGGPGGAVVGTLLGRGLAHITGRGAYTVRSNSLALQGVSIADEVPTFVRNEHSVRVKHREYVGDISVPSVPAAFTTTSYVLNPANNVLFPWLANIAKQYQQYRVRGMVFEFKTMSSDYAASGPLGTVGIASNYNVNDLPYGSHVEFENSEFAVSTKPSHSIIHAIECAPRSGRDDTLFIRDPATVDISKQSDDRFYDLAKVQVMTVGLPGTAGAVLGQLWVSYDIELMKPVASPANTLGAQGALVAITSNPDGTSTSTALSGSQQTQYNLQTFTPATTTSYPWFVPNTLTVLSGFPLVNPVWSFPSANTINFKKAGVYRVSVYLTGDTTPGAFVLASSSAAQPDATASGNGIYSVGTFGDVSYANLSTTATNGYNCGLMFALTVTSTDSAGVTVTLPTFTTHGSALLSSVNRNVFISWFASAPSVGNRVTTI